MGASSNPVKPPVEMKTRPWDDSRPLTAPPSEEIKLTADESEAIRRIFRGR